MTTDLRAALREAAAMLESYSEIGFYSDAAKARAKVAEFRALADTQPTVAELLPMVDATHEVHWEAHGEERRVHAPDGGAIVAEYRTGRMRWTESHLTVFDLRRPGRLVEVSP